MPSRILLRLAGVFLTALLLSSTALAKVSPPSIRLKPSGLGGGQPVQPPVLDVTPPGITSILRQTPTTTWTTGTSVTWRVTFSEAVTGVTTSAFTLTTAGSASGTVASVSAVSTSVYDVTVNALAGSGALRLDLKSSGTGITDTSSNAPSAGFIAGQRYTHIAASSPVAWGYNFAGQLGDNSTTARSVPVAVDPTGVLAGKTIVATAKGTFHSLALTSDGQVFAWGSNTSGQLGNNSNTASSVPVAVTGLLANKTIVAIAAGDEHSLALSADGQIFAWGNNDAGQLGDNSTTESHVPVAVDTSGVLANQTIVALAAGFYHSLVLSADGKVFAWGYGGLGNALITTSSVPVAVDTSGVLAGKTLVALSASDNFSLALSADGQVFAWGANTNGQLGNNLTTDSSVPVAVDTSGVLAGKTLVALSAGKYHSLALSADGQVFAWGYNGWGQLGNASTTDSHVPVAVATTGVLAGQTLVALGAGAGYSLALSADGRVFAWGDNDFGQLGNASTTASSVPVAVTTTGVLAGKKVIALATGSLGNHSLGLFDSAPTVTSILRQSPTATWTTGASVTWQVTFSEAVTGVTTSAFTLTSTGSASGTIASVSAVSTSVYNVTVNTLAGSGDLRLDVKSSGNGITNTAGNAAALGFIAGQRYTRFVTTTPVAWGWNSNGQLGDNSTTNRLVPVAVDPTGVLAGKTIVATAAGQRHSLVLTSDGKVFAWGDNSYGQLGNNTTTSSPVPVAVTGVLASKNIVAIAAGSLYSLALSDDGLVFAWGRNTEGQLGDNTTTDRKEPVAITGALASKTIVALAAGASSNLALSADGLVFAWGTNQYGQLGDNSTTNRRVPVAVDTTGLLAGKTIVAIAAGFSHSLALSADGRVFAWGRNTEGQLGDNATTDRLVPVAVSTTGVLGGQAIVATAAGAQHSLALSADGQIFAWGRNSSGTLGNASTTDSSVPVAVDTTGVLAGKTIVATAAAQTHSLVLTSDGLVFAWGTNGEGELGNASTTASSVPVAVSTSGVLAGKKVIALAAGGTIFHTVALFDGLLNTAPTVANALADQSLTYGAAFTYTVPANAFADVDAGQTLTYSATGLPSGVSFDAATRTFSGTPAVGTSTITVTATDNAASPLSVSDSFDLTVAKASQTISFASVGSVTVGQTVALSATASSGLGVTYSLVSGPATLSGSNLTITGTGSVTVRASQAGDANYNAATADQSFGAGTATATVTLGNLSATYDGAAHSATATTNPAGLTVTLTYGGSATAPTAAGSYAVVATVSDANYTGSANGTLVIAKASQTISFTAVGSVTVGQTVSLSATASSGLGVTYSLVSGPATLSGSSLTITGSGSVTVRASQTGNTNYNAATADQSFGAGMATATVTLGNLSATYDGAAHSASATTSPAGLTVNLTYDGSSTAPTAAGSYAVAATVSDSNYTGSANGTLVIAKASQTISFAAVGSVTVGQTVSLSAAASSGLAVTYSLVSGPATLSGSNLTITGSGTVTVRVSQAGNANYHAASAVDQSLSAAKISQTISLDPLPDRIGSDAPFTLSATSSSGLPVTYTVVSGPAIIDGSTLTLTGAAGTVVIRITQAGGDGYSETSIERSFEVTQAVNRIYFGSVASPDQSHVGQLAMMLPPTESSGHLLVAIASLDLHLDLDVELAADGRFVCQTDSNGSELLHVTSVTAGAKHRLSTPLTVSGQLSGNVLTGTIAPFGLSFTAPVEPANGPAASLAGYYSANTLDSASGGICAVVAASGAELIIVQTANGAVGGQTTVRTDGCFDLQIVGANGTMSVQGSLEAASTGLSGAVSQDGQPPIAFAGLSVTTLRTDRLINLSSRGQVLGGDNIVITGFVITGHTAKRVLLRAIGPGLAQFGVTGGLPMPRIQVYNAQGQLVFTHQGWGDAAELEAAFARLGAFALPAGSADSAVLTTLEPGVYTMHVVSAGPDTGIALAEIYDASLNPQGEYQRLVNISSRSLVGADASVLIGGFVITGNSPKQVLVRGAGPALANQGLASVLADPVISIYAADGTLVARNDNWGTPDPIDEAHTAADAAAIASAANTVGAFAFPAGSKDAAVIVTLAPGAYTAVVSGKNGATGQGLVEIYETP